MTPKKFEVLEDRVVRGETWFKAGDIAYDFLQHDYGLANDDSRFSGVEHTSITKDPSGKGMSFTIPKSHLKEIVS